jgi:protein translocase SecG subunit
MYTLLLVLFIISVILLVPTILLQSGSGAQSGLFGGDITMGAFGAKTSEVFVNFTMWLVGAFLALAFILSYMKIQEHKAYTRQTTQPSAEQVPASNAAPAQAPEPQNTAPVLPLPQK